MEGFWRKILQREQEKRQLIYCVPCHGGVHTSLRTRIPRELVKAWISGPHPPKFQIHRSEVGTQEAQSHKHPDDADSAALGPHVGAH